MIKPNIITHIYIFGLGLFFILYSKIINTRIKENKKNSGKKEILLRLLRYTMIVCGTALIVIQLCELVKQPL